LKFSKCVQLVSLFLQSSRCGQFGHIQRTLENFQLLNGIHKGTLWALWHVWLGFDRSTLCLQKNDSCWLDSVRFFEVVEVLLATSWWCSRLIISIL
jgi:hypothetical protein